MAEKKGVGHAYNIDFLNVVFAASSIFLFVSVIWLVWDDFDREGKNTQRRFAQLQLEVTKQQYQKASQAIDRGKLQQRETQLTAARKSAAANQGRIDEIEAKLDRANIELY